MDSASLADCGVEYLHVVTGEQEGQGEGPAAATNDVPLAVHNRGGHAMTRRGQVGQGHPVA